jgi:hypothetical protein
MVTIFTLFVVLLVVVVSVPLGIAIQRWLFKQTDEVCDRQWELYQQRYD